MISADLGKQLESYVVQLVETGRYGSKSEVLREGVRLVEEREKRLAALDAAIERGLADVAAGRTYALEDVTDELTRRYEAMENKTA
jgi:antitoxin ParD1/3/4